MTQRCPSIAKLGTTNPTLFSRSRCTPRVRVGVTSSKGPLIYLSSATFCAHFGPCVGDLHPPPFARIFEPDHRPPLFRRKCKPMRAPGEAAANSPTGGGVRAARCDSHVSDAMGEMTSCGRRSAGPGRRLILVALSYEDPRRPLDMKAGHGRPHKDRRLGSCDNHVSGAKE